MRRRNGWLLEKASSRVCQRVEWGFPPRRNLYRGGNSLGGSPRRRGCQRTRGNAWSRGNAACSRGRVIRHDRGPQSCGRPSWWVQEAHTIRGIHSDPQRIYFFECHHDYSHRFHPSRSRLPLASPASYVRLAANLHSDWLGPRRARGRPWPFRSGRGFRQRQQ